MPSSLLPHHFWQCFCCATGNRKARLSGRRFGQSGIKCRGPLLTLCARGGHSVGPALCIFTHFSQRSSRNPLPLDRKWVKTGWNTNGGRVTGETGIGNRPRVRKKNCLFSKISVLFICFLFRFCYTFVLPFSKKYKNLYLGFWELTLCGCVTVMAMGYRAQGQGGSGDCISVHGFREGYLFKNECHTRFFFFKQRLCLWKV